MSVQTDIKVKGEVYTDYAFLSYELYFRNTDGKSVSAEYSFSLPEGAVISAVKIVDESGRITNMSVIPTSHASALYESAETIILRKIDKIRYTINIGKVTDKGFSITFKLYVPLWGGLTLPMSANDGTGEIELFLHKIYDFSSPTHPLKNSKTGNGITVSTGKIATDRDFRINIIGDKTVNSAIVVENAVGGEMLCRLNMPLPARKYERLLLVYDKSLTGGALNAAREFICCAAKTFKGEVVVAEKNDTFSFVARIADSGNDSISELICAVSNPTGDRIDISEFGEETLKIMLCRRKGEEAGFRTVTFGGIAREASGDEHIYGRDDISRRAEEIIRSFSIPKTDVNILADNAEILSVDENGCMAYIKYIGDMPSCFKVSRGEEIQNVIIDKKETYKSFAPIGLVWADLLCEKYNRMLNFCEPWEIPHIRSKIEEIGIRYSVLNSETALAAVMGKGKPCPVRMHVINNEADVFADRISMFKEDDAVYTRAESAYIISVCREIVYMNIRSCGGIYTSGELDTTMQKYQSLVCCLALMAAGEDKMLCDTLKLFLEGYTHKGMMLTESREEADKMLREEFGDERMIFGGVPDLLTAAKTLWQMKRKNNSIFC